MSRTGTRQLMNQGFKVRLALVIYVMLTGLLFLALGA